MVITIKTPPLLFSWARVMPPVVTVDDQRLSAPRRGANIVPVAPGSHRIRVHIEYLFPRRMGPACHDAEVPVGQWVELEYKPPLWTLGKGALGPPPQRYNGLLPIAAVLAVSVFLGALMLVLTL